MSIREAAGIPADTAWVRIAVPAQLQALARVTGEVVVEVSEPVTVQAVIDALELAHPALTGTVRDRETSRRRPMIRVYAAGEDFSDAWTGTELPGSVRNGQEPLRLVGAIAGG